MNIKNNICFFIVFASLAIGAQTNSIVIIDKMGGSDEFVNFKKVDEGEGISFKVQSSGSGVPVAQNLPEGSTYSSNGTFSWIPNYKQSGMYAIGFYIGSPSNNNLIYKNIRIVVANTIFRIPSREKFEYLFMATDPDNDSISITATGLPSGSTFVGGQYTPKLFSWTPTDAQVGTYNIKIVASDNGSPPQRDTQDIKITVTLLRYDEMRFDFNEDGVIDILDNAIFTQHWTQGTPPIISIDKNSIQVFYTESLSTYHKQDCAVLVLAAGNDLIDICTAAYAESVSMQPCSQCKPLDATYTVYTKKNRYIN